MPVEIRELVIKTTVNQPQQGDDSTAGSANRANPDLASSALIVRECVEQVLQIIQDKNER